MSKEKAPVTQAVRMLREHQVAYTEHLYKYEEKGGTRVSARELGVDEHAVIKTLVMEDEQRKPLIVLMHGDCEVATGMLVFKRATPVVMRCTSASSSKACLACTICNTAALLA